MIEWLAYTMNVQHMVIKENGEVFSEGGNLSALPDYFERAQKGMFAKMKRLYALNDTDFLLPKKTDYRFNYFADYAMQTNDWKKLVDGIVGLDCVPEQRAQITSEAIELMRTCVEAFHIKNVIQKKSKQWRDTHRMENSTAYDRFYQAEPQSDNIADIYINHVSRNMQHELTRIAGGDPYLGLALHKHIVRTLLGFTSNQGYADSLNPKLIGLSPDDALLVIKEYGHGVSQSMAKKYHGRGVSYATHAQRLEAEQGPARNR